MDSSVVSPFHGLFLLLLPCCLHSLSLSLSLSLSSLSLSLSLFVCVNLNKCTEFCVCMVTSETKLKFGTQFTYLICTE